MLELILILPLYMTLLFIVITLSELGQVATQSFQVARELAWMKTAKEEPKRFSYKAQTKTAFAHFGPRVVVDGGSGDHVEPLVETDTTIPNASLSTAGLIIAGAHAYTYPYLGNPLYQSPGGTVDSEYQDDAENANLAGLCNVAMRGSLVASSHGTVPWLRRHYGSIWVTYKAFGGLFGLRTKIRVLHTVLRGAHLQTQMHSPYDLTGHPGTLRDVKAYRYNTAKILRPDKNNHQFELMGMDTDFEPDAPMTNN